jgi:hypothetical protein
MSDLRIALVAEGVTDQVIIEAALRAILRRPFVLTLLQPEATRPELGGGWCGVLKWCREFAARGWGRLEDDPSLELFDLIVLHVDADVAEKSYSDCGGAFATPTAEWHPLPSPHDCPPISPSVDAIQSAISSWLGRPPSLAKRGLPPRYFRGVAIFWPTWSAV